MRIGEKQSLEEFSISRSYVRWEGLLPLGVCSDQDEDTDYVRTASPVEMLAIVWTARKIGSPPPIPSPESLDENNVLMMREIQPAMPGFTMEGLQEWSISGVYLYGLKRPRGVIHDMETGKMPFDPAAAGENTIPSNFFVHYLLGGGSSGSDSFANPPTIYQGVQS